MFYTKTLLSLSCRSPERHISLIIYRMFSYYVQCDCCLEIIYYVKFSGMLSGSKSIKNATAPVTILVLSTHV